MNLFALSGLLTGFTSLSIGLFVFLKQRKTILNKIWIIFTLSVATWGFGCYEMASATNQTIAFLWYRLAHIGVTLIPVFIYHFVFVFLNLKKKAILKIVYLVGGVFFIANLIDLFNSYFLSNKAHYLMIAHMKWMFDSFYMDTPPGPLYSFFVAFFFIIVSMIFYELFHALKQNKGPKKAQIKYFFLANIIGFIGGGTCFLPVFGINIYPIGNFAAAAYPIIIAYAILAHHLLEINIIIKKTLIYSIIISIITTLYFITVYLLEKVFSIIAGYHSVPLAITIIAFFSIIFIPLKNKIQKITDKYFFHGTIDQIDEENIKLREEIQKSEKLKAVAALAAGMAHEIKNPLTSIKTFTEYLPQKYNDPDFIKKFNDIVGGEVDRINYIVRQLLEFSRPSELHLKKTDTNKLLDETLSLLSNDFLKYSIKIAKDYSKISTITADPTQIKQVFLNLFLNAIDSMKNGGPITVSTKQDNNDTISVEIADAGKGIAKEDIDHIFDPFFSQKEGGTGLGLSVVHGIVEKHGGKINVKSTSGEGASFTISLPVKQQTV